MPEKALLGSSPVARGQNRRLAAKWLEMALEQPSGYCESHSQASLRLSEPLRSTHDHVLPQPLSQCPIHSVILAVLHLLVLDAMQDQAALSLLVYNESIPRIQMCRPPQGSMWQELDQKKLQNFVHAYATNAFSAYRDIYHHLHS